MAWEPVATLDSLSQRPQVVKRSGRQVALFLAGDEVFAIDNRCPHEGYPLAEGSVGEDCVLTCNWHNWKFRLKDGECILGGDDVRSYPTKIEDSQVLIDLADPPLQQIQARIIRGLKISFEDRDFGRICREIARLHYSHLNPELAVHRAIHWSYDRLEFGFQHCYAAAADWLALARSHEGDFEWRLICLAEAVDHMAFDALRHRQYPYPQKATPFDSAKFRSAIDNEQRVEAESLALGAVEDHQHWPELEADFAAAALAHYNDFGHSLIYVYKTRQLVEMLGPEVEQHLLPCLTRHLVYTTREDLLPEFKGYAATLAKLTDEPGENADGTDLAAPFPAGITKCLDWLEENWPRYSTEALFDRLLEAAAHNMLCYDMSYQDAFNRPVSQNVGWLDFTHAVTFANAVRNVCHSQPQLWPQGLLQMACFVGRNHSYLDLDINVGAWNVEDEDSFFTEIGQRVLDHGLRDPIFSAHVVKTSVAVQEELPTASPQTRHYLLAALNRFLNSPLKQKHVRRLARQALDLVKKDYDA